MRTDKSSVIAVWGSPGSGKSTFSAILARYLTRDKSKAIIISPDITVPMLPVWFPNENIENHMSIGHILTSAEINNSIIAARVKVLKSYPFIGVLGYASGDMPLSYPDTNFDKIKEFIDVCAGMVDYIIIDCTSRITDLFTPAAIELADVVVGVFSADLRGVSYRKAQMPLLAGEKFKADKHILLAGNARPYYAIDEMEHVFGHLDGLLPWSKEIDRAATEGVIFGAGKYCSDKYVASLRRVRNRIVGSEGENADEQAHTE
ncbi:MAG: hypothetical protein IJA67_13930 [Oscillospiraceae bacterium]|nr:hypothetical protein [Oscillospiraceae bacterium]